MHHKWSRWAVVAAIVIACAISTRLLGNVPFFQILNLKALDAQFRWRGKMHTSNIVLVVADDKALHTFHELRMFWHPYYAQAIKAAAEGGAKVIGLDHAFEMPVEKWEPGYDVMIAGAISGSQVPVVCGFVPSENTIPVQINMMAHALGLYGFANLTTDADDFLRRQELISADVPPEPSFAMRVVEKYLGQDATFQNGRLVLAGHTIPISAERSIFINYAGGPDTFPRHSLVDFIAAARDGNTKQLRDWVNGKIVLIGADNFDADIVDRFPTPFFTLFSGPRRTTTAGVEIHANTLRTILEDRYLEYVPEWGRVLGLLLAASITACLVMGLTAARAVAALLLMIVGILVSSHILFRMGLLLSSAELVVAVVLSSIALVVYRFATAESRGNLFRKAISLFVGTELATSLETTRSINLTGKRQTVTIMFTDIRGFTAFTEKASEEEGPEVVVQLLNEYMTLMVSIIVKFGGHVNKFIGDGILAVFSDEDEGATPGDHAVRAVKCAARLVTAPSRFETGAGIHTGLVVIGNVGSADKMEYTVLGDTVNLASRLESLNKENHTRLLMSEATESLLGNEVETTPIGTVPVRGKTVPITLYSVPSTLAAKKAADAAAKAATVAQNV